MPAEWKLKLEEYGISQYRYDELKSFCRQYDEKKAMLHTLRGLSAVSYDAMPKSGTPGDPTGNKAVKASALECDLRLIEDCCREVMPERWTELLRNVTRKVPWEYLDVTDGKRQFYETRRRFFFVLDQRKKV